MSTADYDYVALLNQSYFFYEAQRSGVLPSTNRVPWRGNSALADAAPEGQSLVGGQYDAGGDLLGKIALSSWSLDCMTWHELSGPELSAGRQLPLPSMRKS